MPMSWNAENDRLLLFKLIETHGISVDYKKIAAAWPSDAPAKPTAKAISERFAKLRKLADASGGGGTPSSGRSRGRTTPAVTPSKRKSKISANDDEDDDGIDDTPTKKPSRGVGGAGKTPTSAAGAFIKKEPTTNIFEGSSFDQCLSRAKELRMSVEEPFGFRKSPPHAFGELAGFEDIITPRARSTRKASAQASEGMSAFIRQEKEANLEDGEKSSDTDSQASEYDEVEYI